MTLTLKKIMICPFLKIFSQLKFSYCFIRSLNESDLKNARLHVSSRTLPTMSTITSNSVVVPGCVRVAQNAPCSIFTAA